MRGSCCGPPEASDLGGREEGEDLPVRLPWRVEQQGQRDEELAKEVREDALTQDPVIAPVRGRKGVEQRGGRRRIGWGKRPSSVRGHWEGPEVGKDSVPGLGCPLLSC